MDPATDGKGETDYRLDSAVLARMDMRQIARPLMQDLADSPQATASQGIRDRFSMIYVENCRSESALTLNLLVS